MGTKHFQILAAAAALAVAVPTAAVTTTIDFNAQTANDVASLTISGVTFTAPGGSVFTTGFGPTPNGTTGLVGYNSGTGIFYAFRADLLAPSSFVSIDLGDYGADGDDLFLNAYDSSNNLLGSDILSVGAGVSGLFTLTVNATGIAYATFGTGGASLQGSSAYADNFSFNGAVPEPATWAMMIGGFGMIGAALRRRSSVKTSVRFA